MLIDASAEAADKSYTQVPVSVSQVPTPPHSARPEESADRCSESILPNQANDDKHVSCEQSAEPVYLSQKDVMIVHTHPWQTDHYSNKTRKRAAHTVASVAGAGAPCFVAHTIAGAYLVVAVDRAAGGNRHSVRGVLHNVQVAVATVGHCAVASKAIAGSKSTEALTLTSAVVTHTAVRALEQVAVALVREERVLDQRELALGAYRNVMRLHGTPQPAATHN